jgi:hypothetical protein
MLEITTVPGATDITPPKSGLLSFNATEGSFTGMLKMFLL